MSLPCEVSRGETDLMALLEHGQVADSGDGFSVESPEKDMGNFCINGPCNCFNPCVLCCKEK